MELKLLGQPAPRTVVGVKENGETVYLKRYDGEPYQVPEWCANSLEDHVCAWGCMGIKHGLVAKEGRGYCKTCEMYIPEDGEVHVLKTPLLHSEEDFRCYVMGLPSSEGIGYPMKYPAIAVFVHRQIIDPQWGNKRFASQTEIIYPDDFKEEKK
jgi:hypothetical protein